ncbi:type II toxin-antitoxin system RelE/ParE family toxin [Rhodopirellula baltica]|uniref:Plasmid stabilization system protein n=1 Tax=Rhodopirellula baltica SWK14 TaxID=993516 RepID=L7CLZ3_RHOBT|nr:type II toxin-antitoxin system RelE/ParE family toxin [Rhodopirellula baltica]ELP34086.1 plasmid stabilization system protein [Rhodopirellula baltica SWK14]
MSRYLLSHSANANLDEIAGDASNAVAILEALHNTFQVLANHPGVGTLREDLLPGIRVFSPPRPANNYVIFFYPTSRGIEVAAVIHGSRDWITMFTDGFTPKKS